MANPTEIPDHVRKTLDDFRQDAARQLAEIQRSIEGINMIERRYGLPLTSLSDISGLTGAAMSEPLLPLPGVAAVPPKPTGEIRFDRYLGLQPVKAGKQYIDSIGHAVHLDEITEAVRKGGAAIKAGEVGKNELRESLTRSTADVVKVQDDVFGLVKFYEPEQLRGLRSTRPQAPKTPKLKRRRGRPKKTEAVSTVPKRRGRPPKIRPEGAAADGEVERKANGEDHSAQIDLR